MPKTKMIKVSINAAVNAKYFPNDGLYKWFDLDNKFPGKRDSKDLEISIERAKRGFVFALYESAVSPFADDEESREQKLLRRLADTVYSENADFDLCFNELVNISSEIDGPSKIADSDDKRPFFAGLIVRDGELGAVCFGDTDVFFYHNGAIYSLTDKDRQLQNVDKDGAAITDYLDYYGGESCDYRYSNIVTLVPGDAFFIANKDILYAIPQEEMFRIFATGQDQSDTAGQWVSQAHAKNGNASLMCIALKVEDVNDISNEGKTAFSFSKFTNGKIEPVREKNQITDRESFADDRNDDYRAEYRDNGFMPPLSQRASEETVVFKAGDIDAAKDKAFDGNINTKSEQPDNYAYDERPEASSASDYSPNYASTADDQFMRPRQENFENFADAGEYDNYQDFSGYQANMAGGSQPNYAEDNYRAFPNTVSPGMGQNAVPSGEKAPKPNSGRKPVRKTGYRNNKPDKKIYAYIVLFAVIVICVLALIKLLMGGGESKPSDNGSSLLASRQHTSLSVPNPIIVPSVAKTTTKATTSVKTTVKAGKDKSYTVKDNDTPYDILIENYGMYSDDLLAAFMKYNNRKADDAIYSGEVLKVPDISALNVKTDN